ncbi:superinfection immunity protein [Rhizobium sp. P38BS-XIX]|uniref:superinfection immunity protein n=1 Tax=Rhizobium sp. P38BS-XIX TaxID=2726740 RepID=UPI0014575D8E|nr:superinfection immunity protein [Rhizobium sp. P38BS-XIX]NLR98876.1 superinfection immunity protein [Rhizobium sp. P38BS-XIX]
MIELTAFSIVLALAAKPANADDNTDLLAGIAIVGLIATLVYMIPTIVAFCRSHPNRWLIAVINIVLGGTGIGWLGSLVWACSAAHLSPSGSNGGESGLNLFVNDAQRVKIEPAGQQSNFDDIATQLLRLKRLRDDGAIASDEYEDLKQPLIRSR